MGPPYSDLAGEFTEQLFYTNSGTLNTNLPFNRLIEVAFSNVTSSKMAAAALKQKMGAPDLQRGNLRNKFFFTISGTLNTNQAFDCTVDAAFSSMTSSKMAATCSL